MASTAIKVSESLAADARAAADGADRSLTGQIEHWARIGKAVEPLFTHPVLVAIKRSGGDLSTLEEQERNMVLDALAAFRNVPRDAIAAQLGLA